MWTPIYVTDTVGITCYYSLFSGHFESGHTFHGESHNFWECVVIINGMMRISADDRIYNLGAGGMIFHRPLELHKFAVTSDTGADVLIFSFSMNGELEHAFEQKAFLLNEKQKRAVDDLLKYLSAAKNYLPDDPNKGVKNYIPSVSGSSLFAGQVTSYINRIFLSVAEECEISHPSYGGSTSVFSSAVKYLSANITDNPSVETVAAKCGTSVSGLKRAFREYAGMGIHKYFTSMKMNTAKELLRTKSVTEVSNLLGFCSEAYFSAAFKRETGHSPSQNPD